ncbi:MAG TPA: pyruvate dehydrogenase (acetyl-transferring), homodimeric type, partial [Mycobacterium sp.]|nr:pyruvate dehydrogenase (acetyl-transferring), homodimeric type [Mycobacterium sp.]
LNRDGVEIEKQRLRHPDRPAGTPFVTTALADAEGPVVAVSDWMRAVPEQIRPWVPGTYITLGADGFGFSDTRPAARRYFNTDAESVVVGVLEGLARDGNIDESVAVEAARKYKIDDVMAAGVSYKDTGSA